jgi:uncharacterized SAM-binding protein YcdF (DUF218 family)
MTRRRYLEIAALICVIAIVMVGAIIFRGAGRWLVRPDALAPGNVMVVLSGGMPARAEEAARIYSLGDAPKIWLTHPENQQDVLNAMGIPYVSEDHYSREILIDKGVPPDAILVLPKPIVDTEDEILEVAGEMRAEGKSSVIIVTSPQHTRRVKLLWKKLAGDNLRAVVRGSPEDPFDADHWWRDPQDVFSVMREMMGLLNAHLNFPVHPRHKSKGAIASPPPH